MRTLLMLSLLGSVVALPGVASAHDRGHHHPRRVEVRHHGHHVHRHVHGPVVAVAPPVTRVWVPAHWTGFGRHRVWIAGTWTVTAAPQPVPPPPPRQPQWVWDHAGQRWVWQ